MKNPVDVALELIPLADALGPELDFDEHGNVILDTRSHASRTEHAPSKRQTPPPTK